METCYKCNRQADFICPECGSKICKYHMEFRYTGLDRGFKSIAFRPRILEGKKK